MSDKSLNGWDAIPSASDPRLAVGVVPGTKVKLRARKEVLPLLLAIAADYNIEVATLRGGECGCYSYRKARQANGFSDHASGTAVDLNWGHEGAMGPNGGMVKMSEDQIKSCAAIKARYKIIIWGGNKAMGGDYSDPHSWDPMHFALKYGTTVADVNKILAELKIDKNGVRQGANTKKPSLVTKVTAKVAPVNKPLPK